MSADDVMHDHDGGLILRQHMVDGKVTGIYADLWPRQMTLSDEAIEVLERDDHDFIKKDGQVLSFTDDRGYLRQYKVDPTSDPRWFLAVLVNEVPPELRYRG